KTVWRFIRKLKIEISFDPSVALLFTQVIQKYIFKGICPSTDEWIKKACAQIHTHAHTCTHTLEYYSAIKKNEILPSAMTWKELECIMLREMSQSEKDKYHMI
ncbi:LORF2 protein, partial [Crocuta crocuta]